MDYFQSTRDNLDTANIIQFNDYTGTREEFWREDFVEVTLKVSMIKIKYFTEVFYHLFFTCRLSRSKNRQ